MSKTELVMFLNETDAVSFSLLIKRDSETNNSIFKPKVENEDEVFLFLALKVYTSVEML